MTFIIFLLGLIGGCYFGYRLGIVSVFNKEFHLLRFNHDVLGWRQFYNENQLIINDRLLLAYDITHDDATELLKIKYAIDEVDD